MGFDPQTANLPLINVHKRTTKVNLFMAGAVVFFLLVGVAVIFWATHRAKNDTPPSPPVEMRR